MDDFEQFDNLTQEDSENNRNEVHTDETYNEQEAIVLNNNVLIDEGTRPNRATCDKKNAITHFEYFLKHHCNMFDPFLTSIE